MQRMPEYFQQAWYQVAMAGNAATLGPVPARLQECLNGFPRRSGRRVVKIGYIVVLKWFE